jgi:hypothetical protein
MKNILSIIILNLCVVFAHAQIDKTLENSWKLPASKKVSLNLKFGGEIKVSPYNGSEVKLKTFLRASNADLFNIHQINVNETGEMLDVVADYQFGEDKKKYQNGCWNCEENRQPDCFCLRVRYEVLVPADAALNLETISGDIEISGMMGDIRAKSISGFVDLSMKPSAKADLSFKSVTGEIYTDFDGVKLDEKSTAYSKRLNAPLNGGGPRVALETISGDIYFRKGK